MSWQIAKDMAKRNENNLSLLSRKGLHEKLKELGTYKGRRLYKFKKASPELLAAIRSDHQTHNRRVFIKKTLLMIVILASVFASAYICLMVLAR